MQEQPPAAPVEIRVVHFIDIFWCDRHGVFMQGWAHCFERPVTGITLRYGSASFKVPSLRPRLDLLNFYPDLPDAEHTGFAGYLEATPGGPIEIEVHTADGSKIIVPDLPKSGVLESPWTEEQLDKTNDFFYTLRQFVDEVNERNLVVAEVGARVVGDASEGKAVYFPKAKKFIGIDIHPGPGVTLAGDAHRLDELVGAGGIDAVMSFSVLEHLTHPWLLAAATNRALSMGGLVFHSAPQTWPLHEQPNDFWRFSDEGLKVLFGPDMGFEILAAGMVNRMEIHPEDRRGPFALVPVNPGWGNSYILARKVRDLPKDAVSWPVTAEGREAQSRLYPRRVEKAGDA